MPTGEEGSTAFEIIRSNGISHILPPNIGVFQQGELLQEVLLLEQGKVKMTRMGQCGNEVIIEINEPVQVLGAASVLSQIPSAVTATTLTSCCVSSLHTNLFLTLIEEKPDLAKSLLKLISKHSCEQVIRQAQLTTTSSRQRLASILLGYISDSIMGEDGKIRINIPLKKVDIAGLLAVRPEQVSRLLAGLTKKGIIEQKRGWIIITNLKALELEAEERC